MGYVPEPPAPQLNVDRHGMPRDYATYVWLLYGKRVEDKSPQRLAARYYDNGWPVRPDTIRDEQR